MLNPLVSIVIPVFNRASLIGETLDSILDQTYTNWECLVVDDGSTDHTNVVVRRYCAKDTRFIFLNRPSDRLKGANACRNFGFENCNGDLINYFDSDDLMLPEKLEIQVRALQDNPSMPFTVCQTLVFESHKDNVLGLRKNKIYSNNFFNDFITNDIKWLTQAPLIRNDFLSKVNVQFDETLSQSQERDFFIKILAKVTNYHFDDKPLVLFRKHSDSISFGQTNLEKFNSSYRVNLNALINYEDLISKQARKFLIRVLKSHIKKKAREKEYKIAKKLQKNLTETKKTSFSDNIKIALGLFSIKYLGKGDIFFD